MEQTYDARPKRTLTSENLEEAARLRAIWEREMPRLKAEGVGSQEAFGRAFGIGVQAAVGFFLSGRAALSAKAAAGFARGLRCRIEDFSPRLARLVTDVSDKDIEALERLFDDGLSPDAMRLALAMDAMPREERLVKMARALHTLGAVEQELSLGARLLAEGFDRLPETPGKRTLLSRLMGMVQLHMAGTSEGAGPTPDAPTELPPSPRGVRMLPAGSLAR